MDDEDYLMDGSADSVLKRMWRNPTLRGTLLLVLAMIFSATVLSPLLSNPKVHASSLSVIKESKDQATALSLTVTLASAAVTLLPNDIANPIADELSELSTPLLFIVCILYFEQVMLTSMEFLSFSILIPIACAFYIAALHLHKDNLRVIATKLLLIALICMLAIPTSVVISHLIRATFAESINSVQEKLNEINTAFSQMLGEGSDGDILKIFSNFAGGVGSILEFLKSALGLLIDAVAILLITSCVIPLITMLLFVWCIKSVLASRMENLEDVAASVLSRISTKKMPGLSPDTPDSNVKRSA